MTGLLPGSEHGAGQRRRHLPAADREPPGHLLHYQSVPVFQFAGQPVLRFQASQHALGVQRQAGFGVQPPVLGLPLLPVPVDR